MAKNIDIQPTRTYATYARASKQGTKTAPDNFRFIVIAVPQDDGSMRYSPVFVGQSSLPLAHQGYGVIF